MLQLRAAAMPCRASRSGPDTAGGADRVPAGSPSRGCDRSGPRGPDSVVSLADRGLGPQDRGAPQ
jgi:hypothetical protein